MSVTGITPMKHQVAMADRMASHKSWAFWNDTGTGKTVGTLLGLDRVRPFPALVLAPKNVVTHAWLEDSRHFPDLRVVAAVGTPKKRNDAYRAIHHGEADVLVTNYEAAIASKKAVEYFPWKAIVLDESTRLKGPTTHTTRFFHKLADSKPGARRYALTGYPAPNSRMDLWGQMRFVDGDVLPRSFYAFRNKFFYQPSSQSAAWLWQPKVGCEEEIDRLIGQCSSWLRKEDCLDLPPQIDAFHDVELGPDEKRAYKAFVRDWLLRFEGGDVVAANAVVELMKCRQMAAGLVKRDDGGWEEIGSSKLRVCNELIENERGQVMVIAQFRAEVERMERELPDARKLYGGMGAEADSVIRGFQNGDFKTLVAHPGCMSHGLTFVNCQRMIFASLDYSYESYVQTRDRIHRYGQKGACVYDHLLARDTVDSVVLGALRGKAQVTIDMLKSARIL